MHFYQVFKRYHRVKTTIRGKRYTLVVADTPTKRKIGLSKVKKLPRNHGMLFVYNTPVDHPFTMKNTSIPLDIIFLDKNFNILDHFKASPFQKRNIVPTQKYSYVIEI